MPEFDNTYAVFPNFGSCCAQLHHKADNLHIYLCQTNKNEYKTLLSAAYDKAG